MIQQEQFVERVNSMKKVLFLIPVLAMTVLAGCNTNKKSTNNSSEETSVGTSTTSSGTTSTTSSGNSSGGTPFSWNSDTEGNYDGYYSSIAKSLTGTALLSALNGLINNDGVSVSYDWSRYEAADEDPNNSSNVLLIYSRLSMSKSQHDPGSAGYYWNREHTFPQSKMGNSKSKNDNHIIYASEKKVNAARGNLKMGVVEGGTVVSDYNNVPTTCRIENSLFDPHNQARGIVARTTMYAAAMYGFDPEENFESIETMLDWHINFPVDSFDINRNNVVYGNQHNRNPFVDHPEMGCKIWGNTSDKTRQLCGLN